MSIDRREFLRRAAATGAVVGFSALPEVSFATPMRSAEACVVIYLPGGASQRDLWDVKEHTPFRKAMKCSDLLSTCDSIPTSAKGIRIGEGLSEMAGVMHHATVVRSLTARNVPMTHLANQRHLLTAATDNRVLPSLGAVIAKEMGPRNAKTPAYVYIGREARAVTDEQRHIHQSISAGQIGETWTPSIIASTRSRPFDANLTLAGELLESGARYIQVELPYTPFEGFDTHEFGAPRMAGMKQQIDRPIARFIQQLDDKRMLDSTMVIVVSEFGRTVSTDPAESIRQESQYGFHCHFPACNSVVFFGGPFKRGFVFGRSADRHPMLPVENPVTVQDIHATIYRAMGIANDGRADASRGHAISALFA